MSLRRLTTGDGEAFRALRLEALRDCPEAFGDSYDEARRLPLSHFVNRLEMLTFFGAFSAGKLTGFLAYVREDGLKIDHRAWIMSAYVSPAHRGTGAADALMQAALAQAHADGVLQAELYVSSAAPRAQAFYARHGFERVGVAPRAVRVNDMFHDEWHMIRRLDGDLTA